LAHAQLLAGVLVRDAIGSIVQPLDTQFVLQNPVHCSFVGSTTLRTNADFHGAFTEHTCAM
jgi:hypothetical protein